jgi:3-phenylpropionate/trans-cinnamate dioxygenase ferredoxin component
VSEASHRVRAGRVEELPLGRPTRLDVGGEPVMLVRVGEAVYACGAVCSHKGGPLAEGKLSGARVACPWHGWMYDVRTGECVFPGRGARVPTYPTRVDAGEVWIEMRAGASPPC